MNSLGPTQRPARDVSVSVCVLTLDRSDEVRAALASLATMPDEIIVMDNGSSPPLEPIEGTVHVRNDRNLGVTGGRNALARRASGDVIVFLDDDAVAMTDLVSVVRERFRADESLGLVAFKITRPGGGFVSKEIPFPGRTPDLERERSCSYFLGGACAVRRDAFDAAGGYDDRYFYSTEEMDLGLELTKAGWTLRYVPEAWIEHRPSPHGRTIAPEVPAFEFRNRVLYSRSHLKAPVAVLHSALWALRTLPRAVSGGGLRAWIREGFAVLREPVDRDPLSWSQHLAVHRAGGRVFF